MYASRMYAVCLRYCSDKDAAKDILQDGFIKVFDHISQFRSSGSLEGWIRRIIVNTALEKFRKAKRIHFTDQFPELSEQEAEVSEEQYDHEISMEDLMEMVQQLPDQYRYVFNLYVFEDMTHKEIAERLEIAEGTSKSDLSRARKILQREIKNKYMQSVNIHSA